MRAFKIVIISNLIKSSFTRLTQIIILAMSLICLMNVSYASYDINTLCPEGCISGKGVVWNVNITNGDNIDDLYLYSFRIIDSLGNELVKLDEADLTLNKPYMAGSNKSAVYQISPEESLNFTLKSILPIVDNKILVYRFCITRRVDFEQWSVVHVSTNEHCYAESANLTLIECLSNNDCSLTTKCQDTNCVDLGCNSCQYAANHSCFDYSCCRDSDCAVTQACIEHSCTDVVCDSSGNKTYYLVNHTCSEKPCNDGEYISDFMCVSKECEFDEFLVNYSCLKLNCSFAEGYSNHSCVKLTCNESEGMLNHSCYSKDVCMEDEDIINYSCAKLTCSFYQKAQDHECLISTMFVINSILFIVIVFFVMKNYIAFQRKKRKKLAEELMSKIRQGKKNQK